MRTLLLRAFGFPWRRMAAAFSDADLLIAFLLVAFTGAVTWTTFSGHEASPGPRNWDDVVEAVGALDLYCRSNAADGHICYTLVVSKLPVTLERASRIRVGQFGHACWDDTVLVTADRETFLNHFDPEHAAKWGTMYVLGDPALVRQLVAYRASCSR